MSLLNDTIEQARQSIEPEAIRFLDELAAIVARNESPSLESEFKGQIRRLTSEQFQIMVAGRFKVGKSTLLNALMSSGVSLQQLGGDKGPLPVDPLPCTAVLSRIVYADEPSIKARYFDGRLEEWTFERYAKEAQIYGEVVDPDQPNELMLKIESFEIGLPVDLLRNGLTVFDSPGISEDPKRTAITREALRQVHAGIIMFRSDALAGQDELEFAAEVLEKTGHAFAVVNMFNEQLVDERLKKVASGRMAVLGKSGAGIKLDSEIHYIQCQQAFRGYKNRQPDLVRQSRIQEFEHRLGEFLLSGAYRARVGAVASVSDKLGEMTVSLLTTKENGLRAEQSKVRDVLKQCGEDMADIEARRGEIEQIFARTRRRATEAAANSYRATVADLSETLESRFASEPIPSLTTFKGQIGNLIGKKATREAADILNGIIEKHMRQWSEAEPPARGLQSELLRVVEEGRDELKSHYKGIEDKLHAIHLKIRSLDPTAPTAEQVVSLQDRLLAAGLGFVLLGPLGLAGAVGGWRAAAGAVLGAFGAKIALLLVAGAFGIAIAPLVLVGIVVAAVFGGAVFGGIFDMETRIRKKALEAAKETLTRMRNDQTILDELLRGVDENLSKDTTSVLTALDTVLEIEREKLRVLERANNTALSDKEGQIEQIHADLERVRMCREGLTSLASGAGSIRAAA